MAVEAEQSKPETQMSKAVPAPPDGGIKAWAQVLGAHLLFFNSW